MRRFFNVLLQHAQKIGDVETYRVELDKILVGADYSSANFEVAKNALQGMAKTTVEWSIVRDEGEDGVERRWGVSALLADAEFVEQNRRLFLEWSYSPKIRRNLLDPSRYVQLSLNVYSMLKSSTSAALYEVCMRYLTNAGGLTNKAEWEWWRPRLTGVPESDDGHSREYKYFKRDTLMPAIREINTIADIEVELHEFKTGRKITHIQFSSKRKAQGSLDVETPQSIVDEALMKRILAFGIENGLAAKLYATRDEDTVRATVEYVEKRVSKGGVDSPAALFRDALKKGYGKQVADKVRATAKNSIAMGKGPQLVDQAAESRRKLARSYIDGLNENQTTALVERFSANLKGTVLASYRKHNLNSKIVQAELLKFVQDEILGQ